MKSKKPYRTMVYDLRDIDPAKVAVRDIAFGGPEALPESPDARIVTSGAGVPTPGTGDT
jgi:hypothetical protein